MGMESIISDMRASKQRLLAKYTEAHSAAQQHLADVAAVHAAVDQACYPLQQAPNHRFTPYNCVAALCGGLCRLGLPSIVGPWTGPCKVWPVGMSHCAACFDHVIACCMP